ncbi:MAG: hypothetical protein QOI24_1394 [Acidobacteriota bacterium]|jgi:hypothetical protein|nr:hypothetical protein [Acidobacteriota bacterium]
MSDYLRGVVTRVLAPHRVLQPRPSMLFELEAQAMEEPAVAGSPSFESALTPATPLQTNQAPRRGMTSSSPPESREAFVSESPAMSLPENDATTEVTSSAPAVHVTHAHVPLVDEIQRPTLPQHNVETIERSLTEPASEASNTTTSIAIKPLPRTFPVRRLVRDRRESEGRSSTPTAAAPIEITIGRIDVRAIVAPAPPAAKPREKAVVMSLDDYLATRGGGE